MSKTQRELAFLRDLIISPEWTQRFTDIFDKNFKFSDEKEILYMNAGSGNHLLEVKEKLAVDARINAYSGDEESNVLARGKAEMVGADVEFATEFPRESYDLVIADASFLQPDELSDFMAEAAELTDKRIAIFLPTAGSFGEIFSFLWESFLNADLLDKAGEVERLITAIPTVSRIEEVTEGLGFSKVKAVTESEVFDFDNGTAFINSPLVADFLLPVWLDFVDEEDQEKVRAALTQLIDDNAENLTFRFTVKATLVSGEKV